MTVSEADLATTSLLDKRYAQALFELADGQALDGVARDLTDLRAELADSADLRRVCASPMISRDDRLKAVAALGEKSGFGELTRKFLGMVVMNNRLAAIDGIAQAFLAEVAERRGLQAIEVSSAAPLDDTRKAALETNLNQALAARTSLTFTVDPALLGGVVIRAGSKLIDASLKTRLDRLGRILKTAA